MYTKQEMIKCSEVCKIGDELGDTSPLVMRNDWETHAEILSGKNYISQVGVKIRKLKVDFMTSGTWRRVGQ